MIEELREIGEVEGINDFETLRAHLKRQSSALDHIITRLHADTLANSTLLRPGEIILTLAADDEAAEQARPGFIKLDDKHLHQKKADYPDLFSAIGGEDADDSDYFNIPPITGRVLVTTGFTGQHAGAAGDNIGAPGAVAYQSRFVGAWIKT